ncbi:hypothetical protein [Clostridium perfringens]|uniref:hypothetical protein n=1 Tax=Clostridium perfringens TaxID=1502 RepID=UPI00244C6D6B|nr:hypothetical protein [Clostridium perfringens]MDH2474273.1 hypothetical protein [Clostridium perfringens]
MEVLEGQVSVFDFIHEPKKAFKVIRFSKEQFKKNADRHTQRLLKEHLDVLDGLEVEFSDSDKNGREFFIIKEYFYEGESYCLYPIYKEWCVYE